jgi:hypothetical protein
VELDPEKAVLLRWAFETMATGQHRASSVLAWLRQHGLRLSPSQAHRLLRNPFYWADSAGRARRTPDCIRRWCLKNCSIGSRSCSRTVVIHGIAVRGGRLCCTDLPDVRRVATLSPPIDTDAFCTTAVGRLFGAGIVALPRL